MELSITAVYACLLALVMLALSNAVSVLRGKTGISLLDGDHPRLAERMRRHGNFVESVPMALLLMGLAEVAGASAAVLHVIGGSLLVARLLHPLGIRHDNPKKLLRMLGGVGTQLAMLVAVGAILWARIG